jgi:hypothetical protein
LANPVMAAAVTCSNPGAEAIKRPFMVRSRRKKSARNRANVCALRSSGVRTDYPSGSGGSKVKLKANTNRFVVLAFFAALAVAPTASAAKAEPSKQSPACAGPQYRQFDFFAGDWDTYDADAPATIVARNEVDVILEGCVVHEDYRQNDGLHGESYSLYDSARGVWHQSWVTNRGELLLLDGGIQGDRMVFTGAQKAKDGKPSLLRGVWYRQGANVRETATRSTDGGKTWTPVFDIVFKAHK